MFKLFNTQRKILSWLLSLAMILTALPLAGVTAFAGYESWYSRDFEYTVLYDGTAEITHYTGSAETLVIPSEIDGYKVTSIGEYAFEDCDSLTSITIPDSVTSIGYGAFSDTEYYDNPSNWENGVLYIENYLIDANNDEIPENYTINEGTRVIATSAFSDCDSLTSVTIPNSVTSIGDGAFYGCDNLTEIKVDANNKNYASQDGVLFNKNKTELIDCPEGKTGAYKIPDGVTSIGESAFLYCSNLTSITIPDSVTSIGEFAFEYCDGLTSVTIPDSVTSIGRIAFYKCSNLTSVTIGSGVTSIGESAFLYCNSLTSITIPESVTEIQRLAFSGCYSLTEIKVDTNNKNYSSQDGVLFNKNKTELIQYPIGNKRTSYDIPKGVISIGEYAFRDCESLTSVTIPDSVTSICESAFYNCNSLKNITIPDSVTDIGEHAFCWCVSLTNIAIPDSITRINGYAFQFCRGLTNVTIPNSVTGIGDGAFYECNSLKSVIVPESVRSIGYGAFFSWGYYLTDIYILNKDCIFPDGERGEAPIAYSTIHGYAGSTAEEYAKEYANKYGNKFVALEEHPSMEKVPAKAATCTEDGNVEYYHCSDCNKNFNDKYGLEEIADIVLKATGHNFENGVCTVCGAKEPVNPSDPTNPVNPDTPKANGDVNNDGKLSTVDAKWILQNIAKSREFSDEQFKAADLNGDGKLSVVDVKWVLQIVAGMRNAETLELITK